jgi:hypothetical protein
MDIFDAGMHSFGGGLNSATDAPVLRVFTESTECAGTASQAPIVSVGVQLFDGLSSEISTSVLCFGVTIATTEDRGLFHRVPIAYFPYPLASFPLHFLLPTPPGVVQSHLSRVV